MTDGALRLPGAAERDFGAYNAAQRGRPVRPLATQATQLAGPGAGRTAVELGCGIGIETRHLAEHGWRVHSLDADPSVGPALRELAGRWPVHHRTASLEEPPALEPCHLLLSCATLPFVRPERFAPLWAAVRGALLPGAVLAVDLFDVRDDWAGGDGTFHSREEALALLDGLEVVAMVEDERDGRAFSGPKHWHTFRVLARQPGTG